MKIRLAKLTSHILNPFLVSLVIILLLSFEATSSVGEAIKWAAILFGVSILPVFLVVIYLLRKDRLESFFINIREQRHKIYILASVCVLATCFTLYYLKAPLVLVAAVVAGLSSVIVFMGVNLIWKISIHTAFVAASVTILTIMYGSVGAFTLALLPPTAWARTKLEHHSLAQALAGALLASLIVGLVFYLFGLVPFK